MKRNGDRGVSVGTRFMLVLTALVLLGTAFVFIRLSA